MTTAIIGDVHGCSSELRQLLQRLGPKGPGDHIVFVGDLVDKGPDSAGVVRMARKLAEAVRVTLVLGNHEETLLRWLAKDEAARRGMKRHAMYSAYADDLTARDVAFLRSAVPYVKLPEHNVLVTHGGVPTEVLDLPDDPTETRAWSRKQRKYIDRMCRQRYVDDAGAFVALGDVTAQSRFWAETYDGRFGTVVFGHEPYLGHDKPRRFPHATGIDLGCVHGGRLAAVVLPDEGEEWAGFMFPESVPALREYAPPMTLEDLGLAGPSSKLKNSLGAS